MIVIIEIFVMSLYIVLTELQRYAHCIICAATETDSVRCVP
jgi:hypothetical protein